MVVLAGRLTDPTDTKAAAFQQRPAKRSEIQMTKLTKKTGPGAITQGHRNNPNARSGHSVNVEEFEPDQVRPWRYHNRRASGMDDASLDDLALSIRRDGQQQLGLARRLSAGDSHLVEAIFGVRRLEACRRAGVPWRAEVREASFADMQCAALMHAENEWTAGVSPLENALQWKAMLDAGVFKNQSALADAIGCHRGRVSRAVRNAAVLFGEDWLERLVHPAMHAFSGRAAERLAEALSDPAMLEVARRRAEHLHPGTLSAAELHNALCGDNRGTPTRETLFQRRRDSAGTGPVTASIEREPDGGWLVRVRPHPQTPGERAELAEHVEALLASETAPAAGVRLGRRLTTLLSPDAAKDANRAWLEGCIWAAARGSGLDWDRWRCAAVADILRNQRGGWEAAVARAVGGTDANPAGPHSAEQDPVA